MGQDQQDGPAHRDASRHRPAPAASLLQWSPRRPTHRIPALCHRPPSKASRPLPAAHRSRPLGLSTTMCAGARAGQRIDGSSQRSGSCRARRSTSRTHGLHQDCMAWGCPGGQRRQPRIRRAVQAGRRCPPSERCSSPPSGPWGVTGAAAAARAPAGQDQASGHRSPAYGELLQVVRSPAPVATLGGVSDHYRAPGWLTRNVFNQLVAFLTRQGISVLGSRVLAVKGRTSGEWRTTPVNLLTHDGRRYLVAPRGQTQWVRNLRAAGTGELRLGRRAESFRGRELTDDEKVPVLRAYLKRWKAEVGIFFEGTGPDSSDDQIRAIAPKHPAFEVLPAR